MSWYYVYVRISLELMIILQVMIGLQRFIIILSNHLARCEVEGLDYNTAWYKWVIERLQQVFVLVSLSVNISE